MNFEFSFPTLSFTEVKKAITSCLTSRSTSSILSSENEASFFISFNISGGITPSLAYASQTASSTRS